MRFLDSKGEGVDEKKYNSDRRLFGNKHFQC